MDPEPDLDADGPEAIYRQLAALVRHRIAAGLIPVGRVVPSKATLKQEYGVSGGTVDRAMNLLKDEGLIRSEPGKGLYVINKPG